MKKIFSIIMIVGSLTIAGCSFDTVPPTSKGKILTTAGYDQEVLPPGKYTLWGRDQMITLQTNTNTYVESVKVILDDKLTLVVDVRFRGRIAGTDKVINAMFSDIVPGADDMVSFDEAYRIYGKMIVRNRTREVISQYTVEDVHKNYGRLSKQIGKSIVEALANAPIEVSDIALGDIAYPAVVTDAVNAAKERELAIKKEEAQAAINLTKKKNERLLAEADYQIKIVRAKAIRDENKIIGEGITPALLKLKNIEVQMTMAAAMEKNGNSAVFMPYESMQSIGAQTRMFSKVQ